MSNTRKDQAMEKLAELINKCPEEKKRDVELFMMGYLTALESVTNQSA